MRSIVQTAATSPSPLPPHNSAAIAPSPPPRPHAASHSPSPNPGHNGSEAIKLPAIIPADHKPINSLRPQHPSQVHPNLTKPPFPAILPQLDAGSHRGQKPALFARHTGFHAPMVATILPLTKPALPQAAAESRPAPETTNLSPSIILSKPTSHPSKPPHGDRWGFPFPFLTH
jgi:hypothetical protein